MKRLSSFGFVPQTASDQSREVQTLMLAEILSDATNYTRVYMYTFHTHNLKGWGHVIMSKPMRMGANAMRMRANVRKPPPQNPGYAPAQSKM